MPLGRRDDPSCGGTAVPRPTGGRFSPRIPTTEGRRRMKIAPLRCPFGVEVQGSWATDERHGETAAAGGTRCLSHHAVPQRRQHPNQPAGDGSLHIVGTAAPTLADRSRLAAIREATGYPIDGDSVRGAGGSGLVTRHSDLSFKRPLIEFTFLDALQITTKGGIPSGPTSAPPMEHSNPAICRRLPRSASATAYATCWTSPGPSRPVTPSTWPTAPRSLAVRRTSSIGRRSVWPNTAPDFASEIIGYSGEASAELLADRYAHCAEKRFV
jgi:hypothetical protein